MEGENAESRLREGAPEISGFLYRGQYVSVLARTGTDLAGYVCDRDDNGILLDVRDSGGDPHGYDFLPWSSIERVSAEG